MIAAILRLWYRRVPPPLEARVALADERVLVHEHLLRGSVTLRNFRSPRRSASWKRSALWSGRVVVTDRRIILAVGSRLVFDLRYDDANWARVRLVEEQPGLLLAAFDAAMLGPGVSGQVELRLRTPVATEVVQAAVTRAHDSAW